MKVSQLIEQLNQIKKKHGDVEVTCTATSLPDDETLKPLPDVWESTVENLKLLDGGNLGKRVRVYL